jgi:hypothetical protein
MNSFFKWLMYDLDILCSLGLWNVWACSCWDSVFIYLYRNECTCVCMSRHNYLSANGIVSFPSFAWLYKYKEEYKEGEMWHSAQRVEISEEIWIHVCMFQPGHCQATGTRLISTETNNEKLLIARQRFRNQGYIDRKGYKRKATDSFKRVHDIPGQRRGIS